VVIETAQGQGSKIGPFRVSKQANEAIAGKVILYYVSSIGIHISQYLARNVSAASRLHSIQFALSIATGLMNDTLKGLGLYAYR
jgi:hypothetical protein